MPHYSAKRFFRWVLSLSLLTLAIACVPPSEEVFEGIVVDLNDPVTQRIYEFQNARNADSLLAYFAHENPSYRYLATRAFASFPQTPANARAALLKQLTDRYELVRSAAAYAVGQTGEASLAGPLAQAFDTAALMLDYNAEVLAATGKLGDAATQRQIANIFTYAAADTTLRTAQIWSLFYFGRRGIRSEVGDSLVISRVLDVSTPPATRQVAGFYLQRFAPATSAAREAELRRLLRTKTDADVAMGIVRSIGGTGLASGRIALVRALSDQPDWRVRVEALKALTGYEYSLVRAAVLEALTDEHPLVRKQAALFLLNHGDRADATYYHRFAKDSTRQDIRYLLYGAANRHLPFTLADYRGRINYDLQQAYAATADPYEQTQIMLSLGEFPWNYRTIFDLYRETASPIVRSAAAEALHNISEREDFDAFFRASARRVRLDLAGYFQEMVTSLGVGPAYHAANAIKSQVDIYRPLYPDRTWLRSSLRAFKLPREIEAYYAVDAARAALAGEPDPVPQQPETGALEIDWDLIGERGGEEVTVNTSAGRFSLRLFPDLAPASVTNFLQRVTAGYYEGKRFHRVVPNFLIQGGGPLGDGFGAEDFVVRTETPGIHYDRPGLIGLASAGKDTEGVQFYVTHRATPHLDGNYTVFGEVTAGQEVVDAITVGTVIESVELR